MNQIIVQQIIILGVLVCTGAVAMHLKLLTEETNQKLSDIIFSVTLPFLVFTSVASIKISPALMSNALLVFFCGFAVIFSLYGMSLVSAFLLKLDKENQVVHSLHTMFGNTIFLGYPLIKGLYGEEGLFYAIIFQLASDIVMWTFGIFLLTGKKEASLVSHLKSLINPNTIAFAAGLVMMALSVELPYVLYVSLSSLGQTTVPLSMVFVGGMLAGINIRKTFSHRYVFGLSFNKMLIAPVFMLVMLYFFNKLIHFSMTRLAISVIVMQVATPAMVTIVILCRNYQRNEIHATENVYVSTLLSLVTLPLMYFIVNWFFKII